MTKPKVAIITYFFSESSLMLSKYLGDLAEVDYYLITTFKDSESPGFDYRNEKKSFGLVSVTDEAITKFVDNPAVKLFLIRITKHTSKKLFLLLNFIILLWVLIKINRKKYDYVNIIGNNPVLIYIHKFLASKKKIHTFHEVIDHLSNKRLKNKLLDYVIENNINVIVHSNKSYEDITEFTNIRRENVIKINFGLFETYKIYEKSTDYINEKDYVLFFGLLRPYKGLDVLAEAIKILTKEQKCYTYVVAGYGDIRDLDDVKSIGSVKIINRYLQNSEIVNLIKNAKIIVCPYRSASQSGIIMTSYLFQKPVIATKVGAFGEIINDGDNGLLINPDSPQELAEAIERIYSDTELYSVLVNNIRKFGTGSYDWKVISQQTMAAFNYSNGK